ncbi:hypothetical protein BD410DRAFT_104758 [Rickenella mellea]|uniref:Uncharacterized protein n=1 Tax=Rickenella mellea TaxID=50990 RepID=A0A4Y7PJA7_9AGAM|nr:hypothetical protein BD410DRAFT_104758 [Rickenella mellea]
MTKIMMSMDFKSPSCVQRDKAFILDVTAVIHLGFSSLTSTSLMLTLLVLLSRALYGNLLSRKLCVVLQAHTGRHPQVSWNHVKESQRTHVVIDNIALHNMAQYIS